MRPLNRAPGKLLRIPPLMLSVFLLLFHAPAGQGAFLPAPGPDDPVGIYPALGLGWSAPARAAARDIYSGGVLLSAGLGWGFYRGVSGELRADFFRKTGTPDPGLARSASSRLTLIPVSAQAVYRFPGRVVRPFVSAGPAVVFTEESFTFTSYAVNHASGRRTDPGAVLGAGLELSERHAAFRRAPAVRAGVRYFLTGGHRHALSDGRSEKRNGKASSSLWTAGVEAQFR